MTAPDKSAQDDHDRMIGIIIWDTAQRLLNGKGKKSATKWLVKTAGTPEEAKAMVDMADKILIELLGRNYEKLPPAKRQRWSEVCEYGAELMHDEGLTFEESLLRLSEE